MYRQGDGEMPALLFVAFDNRPTVQLQYMLVVSVLGVCRATTRSVVYPGSFCFIVII